ncbi:hypothetical protein AZ021_004177 [Enterobacter ludwigii]|nr:hypothetical protein AZ021_004177 [Enterobacter ludwigii]
MFGWRAHFRADVYSSHFKLSSEDDNGRIRGGKQVAAKLQLPACWFSHADNPCFVFTPGSLLAYLSLRKGMHFTGSHGDAADGAAV